MKRFFEEHKFHRFGTVRKINEIADANEIAAGS
jgi:hypothetical protein